MIHKTLFFAFAGGRISLFVGIVLEQMLITVQQRRLFKDAGLASANRPELVFLLVGLPVGSISPRLELVLLVHRTCH